MRSLASRSVTPRFVWETEEELGFLDVLGFPAAVLDALRSGPAAVAVRLAVNLGFRDENKLTNLIFFARHPEREGRKLEKSEPGFEKLSREWLEIRDGLVRPALAGGPATPSGPPGSFRPVPVESPGGGRIQDKRDPSPGDVVKVPRAFGGKVPLHRLAAQALDAMIRAARAEGIAAPLLMPVSGYRSAATQAGLWKKALQKAGGNEKEARKWVAKPGGSAHQSGRAVDLYLGYTIGKKNVAAMRKTAAWKWLERNAVRFGFYPYGTEPWHWEYNPPSQPGTVVRETEEELGFFGFPSAVLEALRSGPAAVAVRLAVSLGFHDENKLTSLIFFFRHPEREGRKLEKSEPGFQALSREWLEIRDELVRPALRGTAPSSPSPGGGTASGSHRKAEEIRRLARAVEEAGALPGFATFAVAAAWTESNWSNSAANRKPSEASAACRLYRGARKRGFFLANPSPEKAWCFGSGGWFGLMPATGLAAGGKNGPFSRSEPDLVFHPVSSVVMLADLVRRLVVRYGADTWLAVRRGMASPGLVRDVAETKDRSRAVRERFEKALVKAGADPGFMYRKPDVSGYPGAARLLATFRPTPVLREAAPVKAAPSPVVGEERTPAALTRIVKVPLRAASTPEWRQWSAVYFPPAVDRNSRTIDVILYLHGYRTGIPGVQKSIWAYLKHKCWPLREHLAASGKAAVLIAPTLGPKSQSGSLLERGGLDRYLDAALAATASYWSSGTAPAIRHIILAGHSGAGVPMRLLARSGNRYAALIKEVWGFDSTYSARENADSTGWAAWAQAHPQSRLFLYYLRGTPTQNQAEKLRKRALPNVSVIESNAKTRDRIHPHYWVPIQHWGERITASPHLRR